MSAFLPAKRSGYYWDSLNECLNVISKLSLDISASDERKFEDRIAGALQTHFEDFIDQRNKQQTMTRVTIFAHDHRPDMSVGKDGIAIEVKFIKDGQSFRQAIGQAFLYRLGYRFVLVIWVDATEKKEYKALIDNKESLEVKFMKELEEYNIFSCIR